jgi:hypothetical protein
MAIERLIDHCVNEYISRGLVSLQHFQLQLNGLPKSQKCEIHLGRFYLLHSNSVQLNKYAIPFYPEL